ncbi:YaiI/YqxD family protein [Enterococcus cecorum]|nr:YaiI/YqxD family protein [Enterococcus cecorum]
MRIVIDGDGCPVKEEVIELADEFHLPVVIVTSFDHFSSKDYPAFVHFVYVDKGADGADYAIMNQLAKSDVVITQDYGLASLALGRAQAVFHHSGKRYLPETIQFLLDQRYLSDKMRKAKQKTKGPKPFTSADRAKFQAIFREFLMSSLY